MRFLSIMLVNYVLTMGIFVCLLKSWYLNKLVV